MLVLNPLFQKGAVLQQKIAIPVWGNTEKECRLKAEFAGETAFTMSSLTGEFMFYLSPVDAGGPYELKVTNLESSETVVVEDILVGEVWLASGQSNMDYQLNSNWVVVPPGVDDYEISGINIAQLEEFNTTTRNPEKMRYFRVRKNSQGRKENTTEGNWEYMTPDCACGCSAVAAWFARNIQEKLDVPVGIIFSAWGGTPVEAWTSRNGLLRNPATKDRITAKDNTFRQQSTWESIAVEKSGIEGCADPGNKGVEDGWANLLFNDADWKETQVPGSWITQMLAGNGAFWIRKKVTVPENWCGKDLQLNLGGIDKTDITYFNGVEIGRTGKGIDTSVWNIPRKYTVPADLVKAGENIIAIRAYSFCFDGSFNGLKKHYELRCGDEAIQLHGSWLGCSEFDCGVISRAASVVDPRNPNVPGSLFDGMINPLIPYGMRGALWYQGESNAQNIEASRSYYKKLQIMIEDWRYQWGLGDFPFIQVQLANYFRSNEEPYDKSSSWAVLRDVQRKLCDDMKNVYMATAIDIGDFYDIHPQDKKSVGKRMAYNALYNVYNRPEVVPFGPLYDGYSIEGNKIRIRFRYADGMYIKENAVQSFYISDSSRKFIAADCVTVEGSSVVVSSAEISAPSAVRYAWADYPVSTLYNGAELPASSFTTEE